MRKTKIELKKSVSEIIDNTADVKSLNWPVSINTFS